jgi:hypothetical protein
MLFYPMEIPSIPEQLARLQETLAKIKTLLAWEQLKQSEARPGDPPGGLVPDSLAEDLKNHYSSFLYASIQTHCLISNTESDFLPPELRRQHVNHLRCLEAEFRGLNLSERFINF